MEAPKPKIYVLCNGCAPNWHDGIAMAEDGHVLAGHASSSHDWLQHDMGLTSERKHEAYRKYYPDGWELEWVEAPRAHAGLLSAYEKNQALRRKAELQ